MEPPTRGAGTVFHPFWESTFAQGAIRSKEQERLLSSLAIHACVSPNEILPANRFLDHAVVT